MDQRQNVNYKPIYLTFTEYDDITIEALDSTTYGNPERWHAIRVAPIWDNESDDLLYYVYLDRVDDNGEETSGPPLGVYRSSDGDFDIVWSELEAHVANKESFSMPCRSFDAWINKAAGRALHLGEEISRAYADIYKNTMTHLTNLQAWSDCGGTDDEWLKNIISALTADVGRLNQYHITECTIAAKTKKLEDMVSQIVRDYNDVQSSDSPLNHHKNGKVDKDPSKVGKKSLGTFDDYIHSLPF